MSARLPAADGPVTKPATTAQVAGFDISPGYATPASGTSQPNMSAAQANGIYKGAHERQVTRVVAAASGYTFGSKALTPKADQTASAAPSDTEPSDTAPASGGSSYAKDSAYASPGSGLKTPSTSFTPPTQADTATPLFQSKYRLLDSNLLGWIRWLGQPSSGYTLPTDSPALAGISVPEPDQVKPGQEEKPNAFAPPASVSPDFSTASAAESVSAPGATIGHVNSQYSERQFRIHARQHRNGSRISYR